MMNQDAQPHLQAVRFVKQRRRSSTKGDAPTDIIYLVCHPDPSSGKHIILWDDVLAAFKEDVVVHIRNEAVVLPLKDPTSKNPLRIASIPGVTLDVVARSQLSEKGLSLESLHNALPDTPQEGSSTSNISDSNTVPTVRRNPAGGLVEEAMDAYRNNNNPSFGQRPRGPQAILDDPIPPSTCGATPTSQNSVSNSQTSALQETASTTNNVDDEMATKAESGDKDAQFALGEKYYYAQGVSQDYRTAMNWYFKAAQQGHAEAQNSIGFMHQHGQGTPQDYAAAMEWFRISASQGHAGAQNNIGWLYQNGYGVPQDYYAAMDWCLQADEQEHAVAQTNIGWMYRYGHGVAQDYSQAMV
ncbi:hypothetical protein BGX24_000754 [Mortierella sp. AD032]|nr:hypothetical protein BGX24_000754 [Mortierella sp. AD032]